MKKTLISGAIIFAAALAVSIYADAQVNNPGVTLSGTASVNDCIEWAGSGQIKSNGTTCAGATPFANPTASAGLTAINGTATTAMRSDAAPALSQSIAPTWTGTHTFTNGTFAALFTGGPVGIGTLVPDKLLTVSANVSTGVAALTGTVLHLIGADGTGPRVMFDGFGGGANFQGRMANGTAASPSGSFVDNVLTSLGGYGWGATGYSTGARASISLNADETWSDTAQGTYIAFRTTPLGTILIAEGARVTPSGGIAVGSTTDPGAGALSAAVVNARTSITNPGITSDAGKTDTSVCQDTTLHQFYAGSGTLGICLGTSGRQFKTDFAPMHAGLAEIMQISLWNYRYRPGYGDDGARVQFGPTAQDIDTIPALAALVGHDADGVAINYDIGALLPIALRAIQELKVANDNLRSDFENYKSGHK